MNHFRHRIILFVYLWMAPAVAFGWGKTGHCLVGSVAAQVLASEGEPLFENHRYDFCYYNNVPDLVWKSPKTYEIEKKEHFFDLEPVIEHLKKNDQKLTELSTDRSKISKEILEQGRAPWRVHELHHRLKELETQLLANSKDHRKLQGEWILVAGILGHYIADLAQPLHCTENYDGQLTGQKGLHKFFESIAVDRLHPEMEARVLKSARAAWPKFSKSHVGKSPFELALSLCQSSLERVPEVLKLDKSVGRTNKELYAKRASQILEERLVIGALHLALIWKQSSSWKYDGEKFYFFEGAPNYIVPGPVKSSVK